MYLIFSNLIWSIHFNNISLLGSREQKASIVSSFVSSWEPISAKSAINGDGIISFPKILENLPKMDCQKVQRFGSCPKHVQEWLGLFCINHKWDLSQKLLSPMSSSGADNLKEVAFSKTGLKKKNGSFPSDVDKADRQNSLRSCFTSCDDSSLTCPHSPGIQRGGGQRPKLQRMRTGGLVWLGQWAGGKVLVRSLLLHKAMRCLKPGPHLGVHCGVKTSI